MRLEFHEITPDNWRKIKLEVKEHQKHFVASYITILARAYVYREHGSVVFVIYDDDNAVGLLMKRDHLDDNGALLCILDQFFIDQEQQGRGYGKAAMEIWLARVRATNKYSAVELCFIKGDYVAEKLYKNLGFVRKPQDDESDELVMRYVL